MTAGHGIAHSERTPERLLGADWREGRFGQVPGESESIPLPER